jgi:uncharacterized protein CbrC (UPF0167 family)
MLIKATESVAINLSTVENIAIDGRHLCFYFSKSKELQVGLQSNENAKLAFAYIFKCLECGYSIADISIY